MEDVSDGGITTRSDRHAPKPETTEVLFVQEAVTHFPPRRMLFPSEQPKQFPLPDPEHEEQELSHALHELLDVSKNSDFEHVGRQRPFERTGLSDGQVLHWLKEPPEHVAQSG